MGTKTRISTAVFGAVLMFFLGSNIPLIASLLGLARRASFQTQAAVHVANVEGAAAAATAATAAKGPTKNELAARVLKGVLEDDDRKLCSIRYPNGLTLTKDQEEYINDNRYFIVITLRNNEELLHHALYELLHVIARLGPRHVFVSVFENNSKDKTPQFLALYTDILKLAGVPHNLVSTFTLQRELAALAKQKAESEETAGSGGGSGRQLLEERLKGEMGEVEASWLAAAVEDEMLAQAGGEASNGSGGSGSGGNSTAWWPEREDGGEEDVRVSEGEEAGVSEAIQGLRRKAREIRAAAAAASVPYTADTGAATSSESAREEGGGSPLSPNLPPPPPTGGRILLEGGEEASDIAILTEGKWTGNRIEFLARVRNRSIRPLFGLKEKYDKLIVMNDAIFCAEDVLRLALHEDADVACGLDFDTTAAYGVAFYDTWVTKDIRGEPFKKPVPFVQRSDEAQRLRLGKPFPVFCCWNGLLVANAAPFYEGVRFRRGGPGECAASECSLFCKDFWRKKARNFLLDPHVRVAYDLDTYNSLHNVPWLESKNPDAAPRDSVVWPEDTPWAPRPPERVHCWGLEGNGRDPDTAPFMEEQKLELL